jgi:hypothetical protein
LLRLHLLSITHDHTVVLNDRKSPLEHPTWARRFKLNDASFQTTSPPLESSRGTGLVALPEADYHFAKKR